jgi:hypothetical protein
VVLEEVKQKKAFLTQWQFIIFIELAQQKKLSLPKIKLKLACKENNSIILNLYVCLFKV